MESIDYLWKDRKRRLGLPLSFTRYALSEDRLFCETGFLNLKSDEVLLYRVQDLEREKPPAGEGADPPERGGGQKPPPYAGHRAAGPGGRPVPPGRGEF